MHEIALKNPSISDLVFALALLAFHLFTFCVMKLAYLGLFNIFGMPMFILFYLFSACLAIPPYRNAMGLWVSTLLKVIGVAEVWCQRNALATRMLPLWWRLTNMVTGESVASPWVCLLPISNG
jgi:hypothetical protein